ncbi:carboxylesterase/lipase family protein [Ralstonia soli]|uniref:Carboxylic ester hydrolase n=1 Tax=Ralstonia soli TaxID=2953896 RepID=A0ABT1AEB0_9RALS|nr:carboxylesterase family protein [Ralstonia soli]MCO5396727.1 carboxylesterase family protein [Ralstonia soli]
MGIDVDTKHRSDSYDQRDGFTRRDVLRLGMAGATASLISLPGGLARANASFKTVETRHGKLRGRVNDGLSSFLGIRYGADTGGMNRFMPPQPVKPWAGVRDALALGNQCAQNNPDFAPWLDPSPATEDCLMLNVFSPEKATASSRLPVMVWLHGGGYTFGSSYSHVYNCGSIAKTGNVVTVGINHRLNIFGYTYLGAQHDARFASSGNAGHLDIIQALEWVRDNISQFGGDPSNVTVFGQSGGGGKISTLFGMPKARGLFHKAIIQSGSVLKVREADEASITTDAVFDELQLKRGDIKALQAVPTQALLKCFDKVAFAMKTNYSPYILFGPVADGKSMPEMIWRGSAPAFAREVPILMGIDSDETIAFMGFDAFNPIKDDAAMAEMAAKSNLLYNVSTDQVLPLVKEYRRRMPKLSDPELLVRISTDIGFLKGAMTQSELLLAGKGAPVHMYECAWKTPCFRGKWALHGVELPFVFNVQHYDTAWDGKDSDALRVSADPNNDRLAVGRRMFDAWTNFARSGNPSTPTLAWPAYDSTTRSTMVFDAKSKVVSDPYAKVRDAIMSL